MGKPLTLGFKIKRFESSTDKDFIEALKIYSANTSVFVKTSCNEITYYVDNQTIDNGREMYFFGLYVNNEIIGFLEAGHMLKSKSIIIDYLVLKKEYRINGVFYPIFSLMLNYFSENIIDFDYIILEIMASALDDGDEVDYFYKKMLSIEDFQVIDELYRHPMLGSENYESNNDCRLLIKPIKPINNIHKDTYIKILKDIYFSHYFDWYKHFLSSVEQNSYKNHLNSQLTLTLNTIIEKDIITISNIKLVSCQFYREDHCCFKSTSGYVADKKISQKPMWVLGISCSLVGSVLVALLLKWLLSHFKIPINVFIPLFSSLLVFSAAVWGFFVKLKLK